MRRTYCPTFHGIIVRFRMLVAALALLSILALPALPQTKFIAVGGGSSGGGTGTVESVNVAVPAFMQSSGGPVTTSGTITLSFVTQAQGLIFASPCSGSGAVTWRALCAADIPATISANTTGTAAALAANPTDCTSGNFATAIASNGNLTCAQITASDLPNPITSNTSGSAATLAADPSDCSTPNFSRGINASGTAQCAQPAFTEVSGTVDSTQIANDSIALGTKTTGNYAGSSSEGGAATTAGALSANGTNCGAGNYALGVDASGNAEGCTAVPSAGASCSTCTNNTIQKGAGANTLQDSGITDDGTTVTTTEKVRIGTATTADSVADVMISASATTQRPLTIQGKASQTASLLSAQLSTGVVPMSIDPLGNILLANNKSLAFTGTTSAAGTRAADASAEILWGGSAAVQINNTMITQTAQLTSAGVAVNMTNAGARVNWTDVGLNRCAAGKLCVGDTNASSSAATVSAGALQLTGAVSKPTCNSTNRGTTYYTPGGAGVADAYELCAKNSSDVYAWTAIVTVP